MAISFTGLDQGGSESIGSTQNTGSISPTDGRMVYAFVWQDVFSGGGVPVVTLSGLSQTWTQIESQLFSIFATDDIRLQVFRGLMSSPGSGVLTFGNTSGLNAIGWAIVEDASSEVDTGSSGADSVVQSATNSGTGTTASASLAAFGAAENATLLFGMEVDNWSSTSPEGGNWVEVYDGGAGANTTAPAAFYTPDNDTTPSFGCGSGDWITVALEIAAASAPTISALTPSHALDDNIHNGVLLDTITGTGFPDGSGDSDVIISPNDTPDDLNARSIYDLVDDWTDSTTISFANAEPDLSSLISEGDGDITVYLFVVDASGNSNASGHALTMHAGPYSVKQTAFTTDGQTFTPPTLSDGGAAIVTVVGMAEDPDQPSAVTLGGQGMSHIDGAETPE